MTKPATEETDAPALTGFDPSGITRPAPVLMHYYTVLALLSTVAFPFVFLPQLRRTLRPDLLEDGRE